MDPMEAIKQTYFQECDELLLAMEEGLIAMENGEADGEVINAVFRAVHSIKGGGGAFGFEALVGLAHVFETVLDQVRSGTLSPSGDAVKLLLRAGDKLSDHVAAARNGGGEVPDSDVKDELNELAGVSSEDAAPAEMEGVPFTPIQIDIADEPVLPPSPGSWKIHFAPHAALYAKANEPFLLVRELARLGSIEVGADISRVPELAAIEPDQATSHGTSRFAAVTTARRSRRSSNSSPGIATWRSAKTRRRPAWESGTKPHRPECKQHLLRRPKQRPQRRKPRVLRPRRR